MPLVRVAAPQHLTDAQLRHVSDAIHGALVQAFNVPADDRFQVFTRHAPAELVVAPSYLGIAHTQDIVLIQITCSEGRTVEMKKRLYDLIATSIAEGGAVRASDVIVSLVEARKENWSFGNGVAQYAA